MKQWDRIYKNEGKSYKYYDITKPHRDIAKILKLFKKQKVKRILDLGCGLGRHVIFFAKHGFEVYGIDIAKEGLKILKKLLKEQNLKAELKIGNIFEKLPYDDNFFDAIVSVQVLQHGKLSEIKRAIAEIERVLKPSGLIFVTLSGRYSRGKIRYCLVKTAKKIAPRTYIPTKGNETGLTHYIFNKKVIKKLFYNFKILDLWKDDKDYYSLVAESKKGKTKI